MKPGCELDALIAEKVMGWTRSKPDYLKPLHKPSKDYPGRIIDDWDNRGPHEYLYPPGHNDHSARNRAAFCGCEGDIEIPHYSTNIAAAWEVVEHMHSKGFLFAINMADDWEVEFNLNDGRFLQNGDTVGFGGSNNAPHAICLAALKAVERTREKAE